MTWPRCSARSRRWFGPPEAARGRRQARGRPTRPALSALRRTPPDGADGQRALALAADGLSPLRELGVGHAVGRPADGAADELGVGHGSIIPPDRGRCRPGSGTPLRAGAGADRGARDRAGGAPRAVFSPGPWPTPPRAAPRRSGGAPPAAPPAA